MFIDLGDHDSPSVKMCKKIAGVVPHPHQKKIQIRYSM